MAVKLAILTKIFHMYVKALLFSHRNFSTLDSLSSPLLETAVTSQTVLCFAKHDTICNVMTECWQLCVGRVTGGGRAQGHQGRLQWPPAPGNVWRVTSRPRHPATTGHHRQPRVSRKYFATFFSLIHPGDKNGGRQLFFRRWKLLDLRGAERKFLP